MPSPPQDLEAERGPPEKRRRAEGPSWPTWGPGSAEAEEEVPELGLLKVSASVADATDIGAVGTGEPAVIASGIAYLDHMVDQLTAHAQLRVSLRSSVGGREVEPHANELKQHGTDAALARLAGSALGRALAVLLASRPRPVGAFGSWTFSAPLDEAFTDLSLEFSAGAGSLAGAAEIALAPYGIYPEGGRTHVGSFRTVLTEVFFTNVARSLGCKLQLRKVRGDNAHHIIEASFKSFARCLRKALDAFCSFSPAAYPVAQLRRRLSRKQRSTKETKIDVSVDLDPEPGVETGKISTGIATLDGLLRDLAVSSGLGLGACCSGDVWIDEHHSAEDVMITLGKALAEALGDKGGLNRMGCAEGQCGETQVRCIMDLSNRPSFCSGLRLQARGEETVGDLSVEMIHHCFESFVMNALMTVHFVQLDGDPQAKEEPSAGAAATAAARALGAALRQCAAVDPRRAGATASSKGTLCK